MDEESFASWISRVTLPSSQVIPPNTILNIPVIFEQRLPEDNIALPMQDSKGLLGSTILGRERLTFMQFINYSNKCIKCPVASVLAMQR